MGRSVGAPEGVGGGEGEQSSSISGLLRYSGESFKLTKIVPYSSSVYTVFHSVIFNSVDFPQGLFSTDRQSHFVCHCFHAMT